MSAIIIATSTAASAAAISASNSARVEKEKTEQCVLFVEEFDSKKSTVVEQKQYAYCIERLNPDPPTQIDGTVSKTCVVALLIAAIVGVIYGWKDDGLEGSILSGLLFPAALAFAAIVISIVVLGVVFLFS